MEDNSPPLRFSLRPLLITALVVAALLGVAVPVFRAASREQQRRACVRNLHCIAMACSGYHDTQKAFPPAITCDEHGNPMHSWRVLIAPYLEQFGFFDAYDLRQPWNGPDNRLLGDETPDTFFGTDGSPHQCVYVAPYLRCPAAPQSRDPMLTNYVMLIDDRNGPPNQSNGTTPEAGSASSIVILEIADTDIHWMEPRDVRFSELSSWMNHTKRNRLPGRHAGVCVIRADGSIEVPDGPVTVERLEELLAE